MSSTRGRATAQQQPPPVPIAPHAPNQRRSPAIWLAVLPVLAIAIIGADQSSHGRSIVSSIQEFLLKYAGVFALIGLTAAVGVGVLATDRIVMRPASRVVAQSVHRGVSLAALTALITHVALEIVAHRVGAASVLIPFTARFRTLYTGIGTLASDLFIMIVITGALRGRFAGRHPRAWRMIHVSAYLCWLFAVVHGLLGGRAAKPYVDWSYGGCMALVALALAVRYVATQRPAEEKLAHPVSDKISVPAEGLIPGTKVTMAPLAGTAAASRQALPAGSSGAGQDGTGPAGTATGPMPVTPPPLAEYSPAQYSREELSPAARYSQAEQLRTQQAQAQRRMMQAEVPMPSGGPVPGSTVPGSPVPGSPVPGSTVPGGAGYRGEPGRAGRRDWRDDVDHTDPRGWPAVGHDPRDAPDPRDVPGSWGGPVTTHAGSRGRRARPDAARPRPARSHETDPYGWTMPAGSGGAMNGGTGLNGQGMPGGWGASRGAEPGMGAWRDDDDSWRGGQEGPPGPSDPYGWPPARDMTDAHGWTDTRGHGRAGGGAHR